MFLLGGLLLLTAIAGLLAAVYWARVAASRSLIVSGELSGKEKLVARANKRALIGAMIASGLTLLLAASAYFAWT